MMALPVISQRGHLNELLRKYLHLYGYFSLFDISKKKKNVIPFVLRRIDSNVRLRKRLPASFAIRSTVSEALEDVSKLLCRTCVGLWVKCLPYKAGAPALDVYTSQHVAIRSTDPFLITQSLLCLFTVLT